jgi:hypothetical protein
MSAEDQQEAAGRLLIPEELVEKAACPLELVKAG